MKYVGGMKWVVGKSVVDGLVENLGVGVDGGLD